MPGVHVIFRVMEVHRFGGGSGRHLVRLESTQVTSELFAGRCDLIVPNAQMLAGFELDAEVTVDVRPVPRISATAMPPLR